MKPRKRTITLRPGEGLETDGPARIVSQKAKHRRGTTLKIWSADGIRIIPRSQIASENIDKTADSIP